MLQSTKIVDDRSEPTVVMNLNDGRDLEVRTISMMPRLLLLLTDASLQIRTGHLTELEIATVVNTYLLPLVKVLLSPEHRNSSAYFTCSRSRNFLQGKFSQ